ncbi:HNH endonuclease [Cupriavidus sp. 30B13]|uniref:HNH endonuclease n=1 Tax=Cupriavidus sp. 30B13 TaxID=3384241 RepID=UPI003B91846B
MSVISTTADEMLIILKSLGLKAVITKNKKDSSEENYRPYPRHPGKMLDGFWPKPPAQVTPSAGFAIHFVERHKRLWLGAYLGFKDEPTGQISLIVGDVECFEITDLDLSSRKQRGLQEILKQNGPVTLSYFDPEARLPDSRDSPTYTMAQVKRRLHQKAFRKALFAQPMPKCVITGGSVPELLEAAHLEGKSWEAGDNTADDGILLRVDLHRAYDRGLLTLDEQHRIDKLHKDLLEDYGRYMPN